MFEKYNEKARRALFFARYEASKLGSKVIESEHLLLGILREGEDIIKEIFSRLNVKPEEVRREIRGTASSSERISTASCPSPRSQRRSLPTPPTRGGIRMHPTSGPSTS
jgi:ATP-dependent Clp protease ATP-binding subunit ClpC